MFKNLIEKIKLYLAKFKNPDKPRNQWKHFTVALSITHFLGWMFWQLEKNPKNQIGLWWMTVVAFAFYLLNFEINQMRIATQPKEGKKLVTPLQYWQQKWKDSLLDWVAGMLGCILGLLPFWLM